MDLLFKWCLQYAGHRVASVAGSGLCVYNRMWWFSSLPGEDLTVPPTFRSLLVSLRSYLCLFPGDERGVGESHKRVTVLAALDLTGKEKNLFHWSPSSDASQSVNRPGDCRNLGVIQRGFEKKMRRWKNIRPPHWSPVERQVIHGTTSF